MAGLKNEMLWVMRRGASTAAEFTPSIEKQLISFISFALLVDE